MTDYTKLVKALRICGKGDCVDCDRQRQDKCLKRHWNNENLIDGMLCEAAAAIEALQADIKRLKEANDELREAQTYIDHYGDRWLTSAKDVPTAAYEHGYADGRHEAMAKMEVQE